MKKVLAVVLTVISVAGCAKSAKEVAASEVSPLQYQFYNCEQITMEISRIQSRVSQLGGRLDDAAQKDQIITGVGAVLFWPALFALGGTGQQEAEYAKIKGEYEALQKIAVMKKCYIPQSNPASPPPTKASSK